LENNEIGVLKIETSKGINTRLLMLTTLIISGCSIIYEVLISSVSSYLVGDSIKQFSITIGLYMSSMGIGSYLSKYIKNKLFNWFTFVEIAIGLIGGMSSLLLFMSHIYIVSYELVMYMQIIIIGILVGLEIPLLTRIIENDNQNLRITISNIFTFDYIGGLIGSVAFPLLLLPKLGYFTTSFLTGALNIIVAIVIIYSHKNYIEKVHFYKLVSILALIMMLVGSIFSENIAKGVENKLYRDKVILSKQTKYQKIVITKHKDDLRLFINGNIQFSSTDEYRYHESLVHIPMSASGSKKNILILGGGDGLAAREVLKYPEVEKITLVDLDEQMIQLCKTNKDIVKLNKGSLSDNKLNLIYDDAYKYLENSRENFDVILVDLPDPNDESLNKLYTNIFYRLCQNHLSEKGVMVVQSTSPYYAKDAFWCINKTLESENFYVYPYHLEVPAFGDWGFQLASKDNIDIKALNITINDAKFINNDILSRIFTFSEDEKVNKDTLSTNTLSNPKLLSYYLRAIEKWEQ
jgi:spermidine synthase